MTDKNEGTDWKEETPSPQPPRRVSIVVPLQDEASSVVPLLDSITRQSTAPDEIVLVDAGSRDETAALVLDYHTNVPLKLVAAGRVYPGVARNAGVAAASGEWIAFTDAGITLERHWLRELIAHVEGGVGAVCGSYDPVCDSFFKECAAVAYIPSLGPEGTRGLSVASLLVSRATFESTGGFPAFRASEDLIFLESLRRVTTLGFAPRAVANWQMQGKAATTFRRFVLYSRHNLAAGRARYWHLGIAQLYLALAVAIALTAGAGMLRLGVVLVPAFFLARALKAAVTKMKSFPFNTLHPLRVAGAAAILLVVDCATAFGALTWLLKLPAPTPEPRR